MRRTIYLRIAYEGTEFHGWQVQAEQRTVQGVLERMLGRVLAHPVELACAGRTDSGVHAFGQVAGFSTTCRMPADKIKTAVVSRLPPDVAIVHARDVHPDFHATKDAICKLYRYRLHASPDRPVCALSHRYTYHFWKPLDVERMNEAARLFVGTRDFSALAGAGCRRVTMVRTVLGCEVRRQRDEVIIDVTGTGFLYRQVRNMVGTLLNVGCGMWEPQRVETILESRDRSHAGPTAPALGLTLQWVRYPLEKLTPPEGSLGDCGLRIADLAPDADLQSAIRNPQSAIRNVV